MSTHVPGFFIFSFLLHHFVLAKSAPSSIRVKAVRGWQEEFVYVIMFIVTFFQFRDKKLASPLKLEEETKVLKETYHLKSLATSHML